MRISGRHWAVVLALALAGCTTSAPTGGGPLGGELAKEAQDEATWDGAQIGGVVTSTSIQMARTPIAPLLNGMGDYHFEITASDPLAQRYFNQGLILFYAGHYAEATRSFRQGTRQRGACAMCHWGVAMAVAADDGAGPREERERRARTAMKRARAAAAATTTREQAFIRALSLRFNDGGTLERAEREQIYLRALGERMKAAPNDADASFIYAFTLHRRHADEMWRGDGKVPPWTAEIVAALGSALGSSPEHPGANRLAVQVWADSPTPQQGRVNATRLETLVPGSPHLLGAPAYIHLRTGAYKRASWATERALEAHQVYTAQCRAQGVDPLAEAVHHHHLLWSAAAWQGRSQQAINAARQAANRADSARLGPDAAGLRDHLRALPYLALTRFGRWQDILDEPQPSSASAYVTGTWHYARGMAFARRGEFDRADLALRKLETFAQSPALRNSMVRAPLSGADLLELAAITLRAELAAEHNEYEQAVRLLERAVSLQDDWERHLPATWYFPVRHALGAVLLDAGSPARAAQVYRRDLSEHPDNGWSLYGLTIALENMGERTAAAKVRARFETAWEEADIVLKASRF